MGITFNADRDRNDASYNRVVIEFKSIGLFKGSYESFAFKNAIFDRLRKYIIRRSEKEGILQEEYIGIAIDGNHICFAFLRNGKIQHRNLLPVSVHSVNLVAKACTDAKRRAVTAYNLIEDFGSHSGIGEMLMGGLAYELRCHLRLRSNNKIKMVYEEWRTLYGQVADLSTAQVEDIWKQPPFRNISREWDQISEILFVIHTYNALIMKLIAAEIVSEYGLTSHINFCEYLLETDDDVELLKTLDHDIEQSLFFSNARIKGFVEEAIFSWYTDEGLSTEGRTWICRGIRAFLTQLSFYRVERLETARSRDVLKNFYQALVPGTLRKTLGEFYTPGWLVEIACDRARVPDWKEVRVLDPTCGSGSFLLEVIRRKREAAKASGLPYRETLALILNTVWGFDLNPLSVQISRVNFLISIADLIAEVRTEVELPVLLADAVYSPARAPGDDEPFVEYHIGSDQSDLNIILPSDLAFDRDRLNRVFDVMINAVEGEKRYDAVEETLVAQHVISANESNVWCSALSKTYNQVLDLHRKQWNGIWFRIVKNFFWSAVAGDFDVIVGNPPWVRWSNLPERYRERIKPTCEQYTIFSATPYHGGNELDISGMLTYTVSDKWLRVGGTLIFVITQTHFQSQSSQGFRNFNIDDAANLIPLEVDDLKSLRPFPQLMNKTAIARLKKVPSSELAAYPIPYRVWSKHPGFSAGIPEDLQKQEVLNRVDIQMCEATPVGSRDAPWAVLPIGRFQAMRPIQGKSDWLVGRKGVTTDLNGVYMVRIIDVSDIDKLIRIETRPEAGRKNIGPARRFWVEPDLLYPLFKGAGDFSACEMHVKEELYILIPNNGIRQDSYENADNRLAALTKMKSYFETYKELLLVRSTYRGRQKNAPYYSIYNVGSYSFAPYKVVWAEQSKTFKSVVIEDAEVPLCGRRPYIPDHKIYFSEFQDRDAAYFVCGVLNTPLVREYLDSHTIQIQVSNIFKHLSIPRFIPDNDEHVRFADVCRKAHLTTDPLMKDDLLANLAHLAEGLIV